MMVTVNHEIDFEKAQEIALEYDIIAEPEEKVDVIAELLKEDEDCLLYTSLCAGCPDRLFTPVPVCAFPYRCNGGCCHRHLLWAAVCVCIWLCEKPPNESEQITGEPR